MGYLFLASIYLVQDVWRYSTIIDLLSCIFPLQIKKTDMRMSMPHPMFVKYVLMLLEKIV